MNRCAKIERSTAETSIKVTLNLDGTGTSKIKTGIGFFDHMLTLFAKHALVDLDIDAKGDLHVDAHHTVEDVGICLGKVISEALGDKKGIRRYGFFILPMEEALANVALDFSGRSWMVWNVQVPTETVGDFDTGLFREFFRAVSASAGLNIHVTLVSGEDSHHCLEAIIKAFARAFRTAVEIDPRENGIPSSKGIL